MSELSVDRMNVIVLQHRLKTELFSAYIYYYRRVCVRDKRERQEREDRNKECPLEDCFRLQFDWPEWIERTQTTNKAQTNNITHMHVCIIKTVHILIKTYFRSQVWYSGHSGNRCLCACACACVGGEGGDWEGRNYG